MSPLLARKRRTPPPANLGNRFVETGREIFKGAQEARGQQRKHQQEVRQQAIAAEEELVMRERVRRLEKMVSRLRPEEQEEVSVFFDRLSKKIQEYQKGRVHPKVIEEQVEAHIDAFCKRVWGSDSPYNEKRVEIMMRYLKANEIIE